MKVKVWVLKYLIMFCVFSFTLNFLWQIYSKPAEVIALLSWSKPKFPQQTWQLYEDEFRENSTKLINPPLLAALAQVESAGNPLATPRWEFSFTDNLARVFGPPSSSVGLYQFTKGTFEKARKYCVRNGRAQTQNCWLNFMYSRVFPSHSIEMAAGYLDVSIRKLMGKYGIKRLSRTKIRNLAGLIHLCGIGKADRYMRSGQRLSSVGRCGSHSPGRYLTRLRHHYQAFKRLSLKQSSRLAKN